MSNDELFLFQEELNEAIEEEKKEINKEIDNFEEDKEDYGFGEVLLERKKKKDALIKRLQDQNFNEKEIKKLMNIIEKTEDELEKIKKSVNYETCYPGEVTLMTRKLYEAQAKMKENFDKEFNKILQSKKSKND